MQCCAPRAGRLGRIGVGQAGSRLVVRAGVTRLFVGVRGSAGDDGRRMHVWSDRERRQVGVGAAVRVPSSPPEQDKVDPDRAFQKLESKGPRKPVDILGRAHAKMFSIPTSGESRNTKQSQLRLSAGFF